MALSRIWAAFIIVAFLAATFQCIFIEGDANIYSQMVVGKSGDTSNTQKIDTTQLAPVILSTLQNGKSYTDGTTRYGKNANGDYIKYKQQNADGIISTAKLR